MKGATMWLKDGWIFVRTPYDRKFVQTLKSKISPSFRRWDPDEKVWKVDPSQDDLLVSIVTTFFGEPTVLEEEIVVEAKAESDAYSILLRLAPDSILPKIFRLIAAAIHPDVGGSSEAMAQANAAWAVIRKERGI